MVFEAVVTDLLNRFIGDYVENLDKSQLKLGIWGGNVVLDNLQIKENALSDLGVPFKVKAGQIDKLSLKIPWKNLYNEAVVATLDGLYLVIVPGASIQYDVENEERQVQEAKQKELLRIEEALQKTAEKGHKKKKKCKRPFKKPFKGMKVKQDKPKEEKKDTFLEKLATQVIKNLQISIKHIHLRYEDDITDRGKPISMGVTLGELSLLTTDEKWKTCILNEAAKIIYKLVRLDSLCAYWNVKSSLYYNNSREQILLKLKQEIAISTHEPKGHQYIFKPVSASAKLQIDPYAEIALVSPKVILNVEVRSIAFEMTKPQALEKSLDVFNITLARQQAQAEYVASVVTFNLESTSVAVREEQNVPEILKIQMIDLSTNVSQRPGAQALKVEAKLKHWHVTGLQQNGIVPSLVASVGDATSSLLTIHFETNPEGSPVDQVLNVQSQPVEIIYDAKTVNGITEFFQSSKGMDLEQLTSATLMKLEEIREKTAAGLTHIIETRKILDLSIDLKPSYLIIPQTGFYHRSSNLLIVDFGRLQLSSTNCDGKQLSPPSFSSLQELMDRAYESYELELKRVQVLFSKSGEDWKAVRLQQVSSQHVLQPVDIKLHVAKSMVEKDARMANFKVSGELPLLRIKMSEQKIIGILQLVDSIPLPETSPASPTISKRKVTTVPVVSVKSENLFEHILDRHFLLTDDDTESEESCNADENSQITCSETVDEDALEELEEPRTSASEELTVLQVNFEIKECSILSENMFRPEALTSTTKPTSERFAECMRKRSNPLILYEDNGVFGENTDTVLNREELLTALTTFELDMLKLKRLQYQRMHFEVCIQRKVVPRGLRVLKMPTTGTTYPELLCRWQQLNLEVSLKYMHLLNDYFTPVEESLRSKINERYVMLNENFGGSLLEENLNIALDNVSQYERKLLSQKQNKLKRDITDFQLGNIFTWPRLTGADTAPINKVNNGTNGTVVDKHTDITNRPASGINHTIQSRGQELPVNSTSSSNLNINTPETINKEVDRVCQPNSSTVECTSDVIIVSHNKSPVSEPSVRRLQRGRKGTVTKQRQAEEEAVVRQPTQQEYQEDVGRQGERQDVTTDLVHNLSSKILYANDLSVLSKGLSFIPTSRSKFEETIRDFKLFVRNISLRLTFRDSSNGPLVNNFKRPSTFTPPMHPLLMAFSRLVEDDLYKMRDNNTKKGYTKYNLTKAENEALHKLSNDPLICIRPADKGGGLVIMDTADYVNKMFSMLSDKQFYESIDIDVVKFYEHKVHQFLAGLDLMALLIKYNKIKIDKITKELDELDQSIKADSEYSVGKNLAVYQNIHIQVNTICNTIYVSKKNKLKKDFKENQQDRVYPFSGGLDQQGRSFDPNNGGEVTKDDYNRQGGRTQRMDSTANTEDEFRRSDRLRDKGNVATASSSSFSYPGRDSIGWGNSGLKCGSIDGNFKRLSGEVTYCEVNVNATVRTDGCFKGVGDMNLEGVSDSITVEIRHGNNYINVAYSLLNEVSPIETNLDSEAEAFGHDGMCNINKDVKCETNNTLIDLSFYFENVQDIVPGNNKEVNINVIEQLSNGPDLGVANGDGNNETVMTNSIGNESEGMLELLVKCLDRQFYSSMEGPEIVTNGKWDFKIYNYSKMDINVMHADLAQGFTFVPCRNGNFVESLIDLKNYTKKLNLKIWFGHDSNMGCQYSNKCKKPSIFNPPLNKFVERFEKICEKEIRKSYRYNRKADYSNLTKEEKQLMLELVKDPTIRFMKPDKGSGVVVMERGEYLDCMSNILMVDSYEESSLNEIKVAYRRIDLTLDDMSVSDAENQPLHLITSADNTGSHLLKVEYIKADKNGPNFISDFDKTEQMIKVSFSSLDLLLHTEALLSTVQFITAVIPPKNPSSSEKERDEKDSAWKSKGSRLKKALKLSNDSEIFDFKLFAKMDAFAITVCDKKNNIADIRIQGYDFSVIVSARQTETFLRAMALIVTEVDLMMQGAVSIVSDEVFSFRVLLYPGATEGDAYRDMSKVDGKVVLRVGCIQVVYLHKFLKSLLMFLDNFQMAKEAVSTVTVHAAEKAASSVKDFAQKSFRLAMDIHLEAPVFVVPESPVSQNAFVADLGLITIQNTFMLAMANDSLVPPVIDKMQLQLNHMRLYRTILQSGPSQCDIQMLKPINMQLSVERNLAATWFYSIPAIAIKGELQTMDVVLSQEDLNVLQKILTNNFGGVPNELQEEKQPKYSEEKKETAQEVPKYATVLNALPATENISEDNTAVQLYFKIKEVVMTLTKPVKHEHSPCFVLSISDIGTETIIKSYDMHSKSHLKKISMTCFEFTDSQGGPLQIVSSSESNTDLLTIEYLKADRNGPDFKTAFGNTEQTLNVAFASLDLLLHMQALLAFINFFTPALPTRSLSADPKQDESKAKAGEQDRQVATKAVTAVNEDDAFSLKLVSKLGAFNVLVCDEKSIIADIKIQGMNASVSIQSKQTEVFARLQNIVVMDTDAQVLHKKAVSIIGDEVFSFKMLLYPFATEGEAYNDMSNVDGEVMLRVGCIQIVYLHKFLMSLLSFLDNFQTAKEALGAASRQAAEKAASSMMDLAQKSFRLSMDIYLKAPVIVVPESSISQNAIVADLGLITLKNQFSLVVAENCALPPVIDRLDMQLTQLKLSRTVIQLDKSCQPVQAMLQPVNLLLSIHRNLAFAWYHKIPAIEISGDLKPMEIAVSQSDVTLLMKILLENLGEGAKVKEREKTQEAQVSKLKEEKGEVDTLNDSIEVLLSEKSVVEAENPGSNSETFRFAFHFESLSIVLLLDDCQQSSLQSTHLKRPTLGKLNLHLMTASGKIFQDGTLDVNTKLKGCTLDDLREGIEIACSRMIDKKTAPDDHVIIDITYKQEKKENLITAILEKLYVCASMEFLMTVADFFLKAMPQSLEASTSKSAQFKQVSSIKSASYSADTQQQKMTVKALVIDPEVVFVANLMRSDAPALAVSFQCDFFLSLGEESKMIFAVLRDLKVLACPFLREKRENSVTTVLQPCSLTLEARISSGEQNIVIRIPDLVVKISPIILNTVMTIVTAVAPKQVEAETPILTEETGNLWASKNIMECNYWFLGTDKAIEVKETYRSIERRTGLEALVLEVDSVQVTMDCGQGHRTVPVLLAESSLNVKAKDWTSLLSVDALMSLEVHYYNEMHAVWEPLVERLEDGTRRWNLNLEIRNNPAQDTVPGDDFYVFPEPKTSISISSKDTMNVTITKCSLDVFSNLAKAFSEGAAATYDYSVKDKAPYTVRNALGIPLKMQFSSILRVRNSIVSERVHTLDEGEVLELEYSALEPLHRGRLSALQRQESSLFGLTVAPQGYSEVANIPVVKPGRRLYSVRSLTLSNQVSVMAQIDAAEGNKIIVIRSSLQIKNHFTIPFIVYKLVLSLRLMEPIGVLRPGEEFHVPLEAYRCQLFLRPTGVLESQYKESSSHITWKEMVHRSTEIKSIVHCPSTEVGSPPLIVSTVAVPDQITFVASSREEEWEPAYIINLYPTLTLKNLLPYPLRYLVEGTAETHELAEGCMADILHARIDGELMELVLVKYQGRNWNGHLKVHNGLPEFFLVCFTADSVEKLTVDLSVHVKWVNGRMFLSVFSPYWIINQTSRILQYRAEDVHVKHPADFRDIVLFSFKKKNIFSKNKVQLCISTSGWSNSFSLDAVGSYGCVKCPANNMEFLVGVTVKISSFSLTKIITMTPFFTLANKSSYEIEVSEILANGAVPNERWHYVPAAECLPFWPETTSGKMCVRVVGFDRPSKPFFYNRQDNGTLLTLDNLCGGIVVNVDIPQHCVVISFSDYCDGAAPALLINHTPEAIIYYCQSGIQDTLELLPSKVHRFAWIDPAGTRKLTWKCEQNSGELELLKDECGQFPFNQATQIHWVSFLDGRQRVLLFTEDVALVSRARQAEEMEQPNIGIDVSLHKLGLSLVNNDNKQEIAYIGINSSDVIWEYRPKQRWKPFQEKNITLLENAYKKHLNNAEDPGWIKLENNFEIYFDKIPMEMRKPFRYHIRRNFQSGIQVEFKQSTHQRYLRAQMYWLQIDNQLPGAMFPVVFHPIAPPKSIALDSEPKPFIDISIITRINEHSQIMQFKYFMMLIQEMALKVDQGFLEAVIAFFTLKSYPQTKERNTLIEQDMKALNAELMESSMKDISGLSFFEQLHISPIKLHLSLSLGSGGDDADKEKQEMAAMQSVNLLLKSIGATLTDVDDLIFKLGFFQVEYQFYRQDQLMWIAVRHYSEQFLKQMYVLVLGLDVLGNPFGLIRGLSEGVEAFFYEPFQGAVQGPEEFAEGFVIGVRSLLGHTVGGAAGVVSRITGSVGKGLAAITMDKEFQQKRREEMNRQPKDFGDSLARGGKGLLRGVVGGVTGIITKPVEGAKREGAAGFFKGIGKGLVGVVARPTGGIIDMASSTFQGIQRVAESTEEVAKLRSPRVIKEDGIIRPYCQREAEGCELFEKSDITKLEGELYHAHCDVQGSKKTKLLITNRRVMCVKQLEIIGHLNREWSYSLDDFTLSPSVEGASLKLYVLDQGLFQKKNSSRPEVVKNVQLADISTAKLMCNAIEDALTARQTQKLLKKKSTQFITKPSTAL
ncbi:vacuolar protein sorting-associated protein 13C [Protopterus annectens]|uniref:vacuolar protein sorting-associated protein 13C n=1 Tax=Protopterus annectens TaxID=7888 RepID=UPI001CFA4183|nr:vacuolar protein sorting-associated protein 13C [Protopterus annectens]